jgi:hypothetical protein
MIGEKIKSVTSSIQTAQYDVLGIGDYATSPFSTCTMISFKKHRELGQTKRGEGTQKEDGQQKRDKGSNMTSYIGRMNTIFIRLHR